MVSPLSRQRLRLPTTTLPAAPLIGFVCAALTAIIFGLMPVSTLESIILRSGIAAVIAAAEPPLGSTARILLILLGGSFIGVIAWFGLFLMIGSRTISITTGGVPRNAAADVPVLRRADAHPDAPARAPLFANRDLGTPFLEVRARELAGKSTTDAGDVPTPAPPPLPKPRVAVLGAQPLPLIRDPMVVPRDLDQPLAAFDPAAIRDVPLAPPPKPLPTLVPMPRPQLIDPGERFETFELTPMVRPDRTAPPQQRRTPHDTQATLAALLDRLERGVSHRGDVPPSHRGDVPPSHRGDVPPSQGDGLQQALGELRQMATRS